MRRGYTTEYGANVYTEKLKGLIKCAEHYGYSMELIEALKSLCPTDLAVQQVLDYNNMLVSEKIDLLLED